MIDTPYLQFIGQNTPPIDKELIRIEFYGGNPGFKPGDSFSFPLYKNIKGWRRGIHNLSGKFLFPQEAKFKVTIIQPDYMIAREIKRG